MAIVVVALVAFACLTGCDSGRKHSTQTTTRIAVADRGNNRVLLYDTPLSNGESASVVLGQADFTTATAALTASGMSAPADIAEDSAGNLYVSDTANHRVLQFKPPFSNGMSASLVIGQPDFVTGTAGTTQNGLSGPLGLAFDGSGNLWVVDDLNSRVLQFKPPFATGMNASLVIGQADFTTSAPATTVTGLGFPGFIAFDAEGDLWVTDGGANRALEYKTPFTSGMAASLVIGQSVFNFGGAATTATGLDNPAGIAFDSARTLWIGDNLNNRVLGFTQPLASGMAASLVLGQADFTSSASATTQSGFTNPFGIGFDSQGNLGVADTSNNRAMAFKPPLSTNQNAAGVLGQADFTSAAPATTAAGESFPFSVRALF